MRTHLLPVLVLGLAAPVAAYAAEPPDQEYRAIARCTVASSVYELIVADSSWSGATPLDKTLATRGAAAEKVLSGRGATVLLGIGKEKAAAIFDEETAAAKARLDGDADRAAKARSALDYYAPVLEGCIARAGSLIG